MWMRRCSGGGAWQGDNDALRAFVSRLNRRLATAGFPIVAVAVTDSGTGARNTDPDIVPDYIWFRTLEECPDEWWVMP